jgi:hypothetical protein
LSNADFVSFTKHSTKERLISERMPMKNGFTRMLCSIVLFALTISQPQPHGLADAGAADVNVDQIFTRYVQALGGRVAFERVRSRIASGSVEMASLKGKGTINFYAKAPNKFVNEMRLPVMGVLKQGFDGKTGWHSNSFGEARIMEGDELVAMRRDAEFYREINFRDSYSRVSLKGKDKVGEREVYVVEGLLPDGTPERLYFDTQTGLLLRLSTERASQFGKLPADLYLWDYREVDGIKLPFWQLQSSTLPTGGGVALTIKWEQIKHNVPIDESIFKIPKAQ